MSVKVQVNSNMIGELLPKCDNTDVNKSELNENNSALNRANAHSLIQKLVPTDTNRIKRHVTMTGRNASSDFQST